MKFIPTLALTAIGSVVVLIAVQWFLFVSHTFFYFYSEFYFELIPQLLFSFCIAILYYRMSDTNRKLLKSIVIAITPFILMVCFYVAFFLFLVICEDPFPVPD